MILKGGDDGMNKFPDCYVHVVTATDIHHLLFTFVPLHAAAVVGSSDLLIFEGFEACMYEEKIGG